MIPVARDLNLPPLLIIKNTPTLSVDVSTSTVGWTDFYFFYRTEDGTYCNKRSGMILEVQIQIFGPRAGSAKLSFSKDTI